MQTTSAGRVLKIINNFCEIYASRFNLPDRCRNQLQKKTVVPLQERQFLWSTQDSSVCAVERKENAQLPSGVSADAGHLREPTITMAFIARRLGRVSGHFMMLT